MEAAMNKSSRIIIFISLLILVSLACNAPILNQIMDNAAPPEDASGSDAVASSDTNASDSFMPGIPPPANTDGAEVTYIPGATFLMGSVTTDLLADEDELPQHEVTVDEFYIYTYEVTNQMYADCVEAGYCMNLQSLEAGPTSHYEDPEFQDHPVVGVDWVMARDYCAWAGARLPTEAEWELVSRGPDSFLYPWGEEEPTCDYVNMDGCLDPPDTQPVGNYLMGNSPEGVWDMSGTVWTIPLDLLNLKILRTLSG
jgi:formylglycine-generating enzyme required for sulfatase activity